MNKDANNTVLTSPFMLRPYNSGDETQIIRLFKEVFGTSRSIDHWQWQFLQNPYDNPKAMLSFDLTNGKLLAQYTVMPVNINIKGIKHKAAQSVDTMVDNGFRMRGIFETSAKKCFRQLQQDGYTLVYGLPNSNSYIGFIRKLGWTNVLYLPEYFLRLSISRALKTYFRFSLPAEFIDSFFRKFVWLRLQRKKTILGRNLNDIKLYISPTVPSEYEELWDAVRGIKILSVWKDSKYFEWRYDKNPSHSFRYFFLRKESKIEALCVVVTENHICEVLELIVRNHNVDLARYLILSVALKAYHEGVSRIKFSGSTPNFFDEVFKNFHKANDISRVFCLGLLNNTALAQIVTTSTNWTITGGDIDGY